MSNSGVASWAALRADLREHYAAGDVIEGPSELIAEIDRINEFYKRNSASTPPHRGRGSSPEAVHLPATHFQTYIIDRM